jgi:predicted DNA-binding transcriptional regulator AlpA
MRSRHLTRSGQRPSDADPTNAGWPLYNAQQRVPGLSPAAVAIWPLVARQLRDAGALQAVPTTVLAEYCEAFAQWCAAGEKIAAMLLAFGVQAGSERTKPQVDAPFSERAEVAAEASQQGSWGPQRSPNAILRLPEVMAETRLSRSTIYKRINEGSFPAPLKLGARTVGWRVAQIEAFLAAPADYRK